MEELCRRFGRLAGVDVEEFNKLVQQNTVLNYQERFEEMRSLLPTENSGFTERYFISISISGLKEELRPVVRMH